jgi:hypothetical protein
MDWKQEGGSWAAWSAFGVYRVQLVEGRWHAGFAEVGQLIGVATALSAPPQRRGFFVPDPETGRAWADDHARDWRPPQR